MTAAYEAALKDRSAGDTSRRRSTDGRNQTLEDVVEFGRLVGELAIADDPSADGAREAVAAAARNSTLPLRWLEAEGLMQALTHPRLLVLPPRAALERQLGLFFALAPVTAASLWARDGSGDLLDVAARGPDALTKGMRREALRAVAGTTATAGPRRTIAAVPILVSGRPAGALALRARPADLRSAHSLAIEAAAAMNPVLEREALLARSAEYEVALVTATERRLARLGFDLHDGALQELAVLSADVRRFRIRLATSADSADAAPVVRMLDELGHSLVGIDRELRELVTALEPSSVLDAPFVDALEREISAFRERSGISVDLFLDGDLRRLTRSQRIVLLRVVREALTNVRRHSGADRAVVRIARDQERIEVEVVDDGRGFDVRKRLARARRSGKLGLVGMFERVRLLGGELAVQSSPGGPTRVTAIVPDWKPVTDELSAPPDPLARATGRELPRRASSSASRRGRKRP